MMSLSISGGRGICVKHFRGRCRKLSFAVGPGQGVAADSVPGRHRRVFTMGHMSEPEEPEAQFHRDRHEHGGAADRLDDDRLARLTEEERVELGLEDYEPDEVPPAT